MLNGLSFRRVWYGKIIDNPKPKKKKNKTLVVYTSGIKG